MSGRGGGRGGGRGHIAMTQAELTDLINTRVAEALAAYQAGTICKTTTSTGSLLVGQRGLLVDSAIRFGTLTTFEENGRELITLKHDQCFDRGIGVGNHISYGHSVIE
ncbi:hypothetical protein HanPI659440_Chr11g0440691 [Helianthus annuus]|nr:hypothetical protein HanPI659440_Chr11g0440691 [Helianthus annuus]